MRRREKIKQFLKAFAEGEEAHLDIAFEFRWWELVPILTIIGLIIYLIVR